MLCFRRSASWSKGDAGRRAENRPRWSSATASSSHSSGRRSTPRLRGPAPRPASSGAKKPRGSPGGLILNVSGKVVANYWLSHVYAPEIGHAHRNGDVHIHDLDMLAGYCAGWSLRQLLHEGLNGVPGKVEAGPPKHMSSAVGQIVNFLGTLQNEWAGAQAFSSFDTYMAPYVRKDAMSYGEVRQCIQELIYNLNVPSRWGTQTPFTNLTFDWTCPEDLRPQIPVIGGEEMPFTYGELQAEMDMINRA